MGLGGTTTMPRSLTTLCACISHPRTAASSRPGYAPRPSPMACTSGHALSCSWHRGGTLPTSRPRSASHGPRSTNGPQVPCARNRRAVGTAAPGTRGKNLMHTPLADDLITATLACPCDTRPGPLCARCECLLTVIQAIDLWQAEQIARMTGLALPPPPMGRLGRLGYTVLASGVVAVCLLYYAWEMGVLRWQDWRGRCRAMTEPRRKHDCPTSPRASTSSCAGWGPHAAPGRRGYAGLS